MMYFIPEYLFKIIQQQQENLNKLISNKEIKINLDSLKINYWADPKQLEELMVLHEYVHQTLFAIY